MYETLTGSSVDFRDTTAAKSLKNEIEVTEMYPMERKKRSLAIIFCHETFYRNNEKARIGVEGDCNKLKSVLETFNFEVQIYEDKRKMEIFDILTKVSQEDQSNTDCLLIIVLTHGNSGILCSYDGQYKILDLWNTFSEKNCPSLKGKPKLFFLQACRGDDVDSGTYLWSQKNSKSQRLATSKDSLKLKASNSPNANPSDLKPEELDLFLTPDERDFLIGYATAPGYIAFKHKYGSWFIQEICSIFERYGKYYDLLTLLTFVSQRVAVNYVSDTNVGRKYDNKKQVPCIITTLTKRLFFVPEDACEVDENLEVDPV
ncbi:hypothetical protein M0802_000713 [Mischocyttarus mexicanus]|nr:hypothetical protein M0802_000713 [Mischocyttarus mexicanus]